jgi:hypothetical protein
VRIVGSTVRRALNQARLHIASPVRLGRLALAVGICAGLSVSALGPIAAVHADLPDDPSARLQIIVHSVYIRDDRDSQGEGDMALFIRLSDHGPGGRGPEEVVMFWGENFGGSSGTLHSLERLTPQNGDELAGGATPGEGIPVYDEWRYRMYVYMEDDDLLRDDDMGSLRIDVNAANGWSLGTYTVRSSRDDGTPGDYDMTFEIRRAPLPDLFVNDFSSAGAPGSELVCGQIRNAGQRFSGPIPLIVRTEGKIIEQTTLTGLQPGTTSPHCVRRALLPAHKHNLVFSLDDARQIAEVEEFNNVDVASVEASAEGIPDAAPVGPPPVAPDQVVAPSPEPKPGGAKSDLLVRAIKVNGQVPDGKDDCNVGKNEVTIVIKNGGAGESGSFAVRFGVDGNELDETVENVRAGEEREIVFENLQWKKGEHTLRVTVDAERAVDESREDNNDRKVTARCSDAS